MKNLITGAAMLVASVSAFAGNPLANIPGYGEYSETAGYILKCPVQNGNYFYWFSAQPGNGRVVISRIGYPNGNQLFARVVDGQQIKGGYELLLRNEQGRDVYVKFSGKSGSISINGIQARCSVSKTSFIH